MVAHFLCRFNFQCYDLRIFGEIINECHDESIAVFHLLQSAHKINAYLTPDYVRYRNWVKDDHRFLEVYIFSPLASVTGFDIVVYICGYSRPVVRLCNLPSFYVLS